MTTRTKVIGGITAAVTIAAVAFIFFRFFFVFGEGVKAGDLNQVMYKGYIFKTYEGRLIQSGLRGVVKAPTPWNPTSSNSPSKTKLLQTPS